MEDGNGNIIYSGGNQRAVGGDDDSGAYSDDEPTLIELALPKDDCYAFNFYEIGRDGFENVNYKFYNSSGNVILEGPSATATKTLEVQPLELKGGTDVMDNLSVLAHSGESGFFCYDYTYTPSVTVQNIGSNAITSMTINAVSSSNGLLHEINWTGNITPAGFGVIDMKEITLGESSDISYEVMIVNGNQDSHIINNTITTSFENPLVKTETITLEILFDIYGAEDNTWFFINSAGDTLETGPGVNGLLSKELTIPSAENDCYEILLKDSYGDGLHTYGNGSSYLRVIDATGSRLVNVDLTSENFEELPILIEAQLDPSAVSDLSAVEALKVYPNPATDLMTIDMETTEGMSLDISIIDTYGQLISNQQESITSAGRFTFDVDVNVLDAGVYLLEISTEFGIKTRKFYVIR